MYILLKAIKMNIFLNKYLQTSFLPKIGCNFTIFLFLKYDIQSECKYKNTHKHIRSKVGCS